MLKYKIGSSTYVYDDNRMLLLEENLYNDCKFNYGTVESCDNIINLSLIHISEPTRRS